MPKIIFTGGGSAGHVTPNIALMKQLQQYDIAYIGSHHGIEKQLIEPLNIPYYSVSTGKLRRYFSWQNFIDPFKLFAGIIKSTWLCFYLNPDVIFSKGGFVSLPVVIGAWISRKPIILHESDLTPGLANRLCAPFAKKICLTFQETEKYIKAKDKLLVTGTPVREELLHGDKNKGLRFASLTDNKPVILVICGSLGSKRINKTLRNILPELLEKYLVIHVCGKGNIDETTKNENNYRQYEYLTTEYPDLLACADVVISRAGANSLYELLAAKKPHLLIPLSKKASRGDQIVNAEHFKELGLSETLPEDNLNEENLLASIKHLHENINTITEKLNAFQLGNSNDKLISLIKSFQN